jgi:hypothetical protein
VVKNAWQEYEYGGKAYARELNKQLTIGNCQKNALIVTFFTFTTGAIAHCLLSIGYLFDGFLFACAIINAQL